MFIKFEESDFSLFDVPGLDERMRALKFQLRPKFEAMGTDLSAELTQLTGMDFFPHVAKHARRKTNPPDDSWVAFSSNPRGYKMMPHFQITVWSTHVLIQWGIIYEAKSKEPFARNLLDQLEQVKQSIPAHYQWSKDHQQPEGVLHRDMTDSDFESFAERLMHHKKGEVMVGLPLSKEDALSMDADEFYLLVRDTWSKLLLLHKLSQ